MRYYSFIRISIMMLFFSIIVIECSKNQSTEPSKPPAKDYSVECGNESNSSPQVNPYDGSFSQASKDWYITQGISISPDNKYIAFSTARVPSPSTCYLYSFEQKKYLFKGNAGSFVFSPDSKYVIIWSNTEYRLYEFDLTTLEKRYFYSKDDYVSPWSRYSNDGRFIYFCTNGTTHLTEIDKKGMFRFDKNENKIEYVSVINGGYEILNDSTLMSVNFSESSPAIGLQYININTGTQHTIPVRNLPASVYDVWYDLSQDQQKILVEIFIQHDPITTPLVPDNIRAQQGVWLLNIKDMTLKQILKGQSFVNKYYWPKWSSNNTFIASWHCVKDSSTTIWEYDLSGTQIRQLTNKNMKY